MRTLAVVVPNWNGLEDTRALLPTLERCRLPEGWRVRVLVLLLKPNPTIGASLPR